MDQPALMGGVERRADLGGDLQRPVDRQHRLGAQHFVQVCAADVAHRDEQQPAVFAGLVQRDDVRVIDRGREPRLGLESHPEPRVVRELRHEDLQCDLATERELLGEVHDAHPATPEHALDAVPRELRAGLKPVTVVHCASGPWSSVVVPRFSG